MDEQKQVFTLNPPPMFPLRLGVGDAVITLRADGTFEGDAVAMAAAIENQAKQDFTGVTGPLLWLIARALRQNDRTDTPTSA